MPDGTTGMMPGALGGGYAPGSTSGLGPSISEMHDNGALATDQFTIDTGVDSTWHGSASSWLPVATATEQTGLTAADTGAGMSDTAYLSDYGKKGPSTKVVPGSALKIDDSADNAGKGDGFSISTASGERTLWKCVAWCGTTVHVCDVCWHCLWYALPSAHFRQKCMRS